MANIANLKEAVNSAPVVAKGNTLKALLSTDSIRSRFNEMLGKKAPGFISSILSATANNKALATADPTSVISAAAVAASLDLPINQSLGFAYIVPYKGVAAFQLGWRGLVQLAMRSGQYKTMNASVVYDGELKSHNPFSGEMEFDHNGKKSDTVVGYVFFYRLVNGFEKWEYWTKGKVQAHAKRYSQSYRNNQGPWADDFDAMALKTVVKSCLGKWGILSIEMQHAMEFDQAVVNDDLTKKEYVDNAIEGEVVNTEANANG